MVGYMPAEYMRAMRNAVERLSVEERAWFREGVRRNHPGPQSFRRSSSGAREFLKEAREQADIRIVSVPDEATRQSPIVRVMSQEFDEELFETDRPPGYTTVTTLMTLLRTHFEIYSMRGGSYEGLELCIQSPSPETCGDIENEVRDAMHDIEREEYEVDRIMVSPESYCMTLHSEFTSMCMDSMGNVGVEGTCAPDMHCQEQ